MAREPLSAIGGIQQLGLGVTDAHAAFSWYRRYLGMDIRLFDDECKAELMTRYTGGESYSRRAILGLNLRGGAGIEFWHYIDRVPRHPRATPHLGDLGIFAARIKSDDLAAARARLDAGGASHFGTIEPDPWGTRQLWLQDPFGNWLQLVESDQWFSAGVMPTGGVSGCWIGVSDIDRALTLYRDVLGFDRVVGDRTGVFADLAALPGGCERMRRVRLTHEPRALAFSRLLGVGQIELIQSLERQAPALYTGRHWGDLGFMHVCLDVAGLDDLKPRFAEAGFPFTVDSETPFTMEEAAGRFAYVEDPDGTLIELVETHRIPIVKPLGLYVDLRRRGHRALPPLMIKALALHRVKDPS
jgi:catechol 2,3-dioxygenase-like lactoylglutathione lyase family enzyme